MEFAETSTPKVKLLEQQQLILDLDVREICGDRYLFLQHGDLPNVASTQDGAYFMRDHQGVSWALHKGAPMGEVQTELKLDRTTDDTAVFAIAVWVPLLGALTVYQHSWADNITDAPGYRYLYKFAIGNEKPADRFFKCAAAELQTRFTTVAQTRITSQRRASLRDIAALLKQVAEKKEAQASLQEELDDVHLYRGHTQTGNPAAPHSLEIIMTAAATTATVAKVGDKFTCTLGTTVLGTSKWPDYFELHLRKGDVKVLREAGITHIAYEDGKTVDVTKPAAKAVTPAATPAADASASVSAPVAVTAPVADASAPTVAADVDAVAA